jgi:hypothetical protein
MRAAIACALILATATVAHAEAQAPAQRTAKAVARPVARPVEDPSRRGREAVQDLANKQGRQLTECFARAARQIRMTVVIAFDGAKLRSKVKQSSGATKQIEACVVDVFDHINLRLPAQPITVELPVSFSPATAGA